jgi:hypothetical protein
MARKTIQIVTDDYSGEQLDAETAPIRVRVGRLAWNLYLSEDNERKLQDALAPFVKDAETANISDPSPRRGMSKSAAGSAEQRKRQRAAIQAFAKSKKLKVPGDRGRIDASVAEAFYSSNPGEPPLFA